MRLTRTSSAIFKFRYAMAQQTFNGVSLFATTTSRPEGVKAVFNNASLDNTVSVFVSADGSTGAKVRVEQSNPAFRSYHQLQHSCVDRFLPLPDNSANAAGAIADFYLRCRRLCFNDELERRRLASSIKRWRT